MKLTHMEERVVHQLCKGYISKQIADKMNISMKTVASHIYNAKARNDLNTTNQLCAHWTREIYTKGE